MVERIRSYFYSGLNILKRFIKAWLIVIVILLPVSFVLDLFGFCLTLEGSSQCVGNFYESAFLISLISALIYALKDYRHFFEKEYGWKWFILLLPLALIIILLIFTM